MQISELSGSIFFSCSACMSVFADALSWASANKERITKSPTNADNIVVLSCQVTDLAILNDLHVAERYACEFPSAQIFISGCLAERADIALPDGIKRLTQMRSLCGISDCTLVHFERPFWVPDFNELGESLEDGHLFRNMYPLRIGKGCMFNCTYCTIRVTRGAHEVYGIDDRLIQEFLDHDDVLLVADSPTEKQVRDWCSVAVQHKKPFSIRNVEPHVTIRASDSLVEVARLGLLKIFHSPVQSTNADVLRDMNRSVEHTIQTVALSRFLKSLGVTVATNIIIDYKDYPNEVEEINLVYDYVSWNPYFDGKFERQIAQERYDRYIGPSMGQENGPKKG